MQRVRIAKAFFFMVVSSSICNRPWITCLYCTRERLVQVGHVSHSGGLICADKWQYVWAQKRGGPADPILPWLGVRSFNDCACDAACEPLMLDLDARNLDFACLGNCLRHVIGELDGVEERLGFFLMQIEVRDEDVDASRLNVGKEEC